MQTWCITHHTACCPDRPKGTILLEAKTHRGCVATREGVRVGLSGPQLVAGWSSAGSWLVLNCFQISPDFLPAAHKGAEEHPSETSQLLCQFTLPTPAIQTPGQYEGLGRKDRVGGEQKGYP